MKKLTIIISMTFICAIAVWMLSPDPTLAQRDAVSVKASAHVAGVVIGKPVRSERNIVLGTVENIVVNDTGCVQYLIMSGKFPGARARLYPMPWSVIARTAPDAYFVMIDEQVLVKAPSFEVNRWPDLSQSEWQTKVHTFYQAGAEVTAPGKEGRPEAVRPEDKSKAETGLKHSTEEAAPSHEKVKDKTHMERERKGQTSEMVTPESSKQKEMDTRTKQQTQPKEGQEKGGQSQMMERSHEKGGPAQGASPGEPSQESEKVK